MKSLFQRSLIGQRGLSPLGGSDAPAAEFTMFMEDTGLPPVGGVIPENGTLHLVNASTGGPFDSVTWTYSTDGVTWAPIPGAPDGENWIVTWVALYNEIGAVSVYFRVTIVGSDLSRTYSMTHTATIQTMFAADFTSENGITYLGENETLPLIDTTSGGPPTSWNWEIYDENTLNYVTFSTSQNPSMTWSQLAAYAFIPGNCQIRLTVTSDAGGYSQSADHYFYLFAAPTSPFFWSPTDAGTYPNRRFSTLSHPTGTITAYGNGGNGSTEASSYSGGGSGEVSRITGTINDLLWLHAADPNQIYVNLSNDVTCPVLAFSASGDTGGSGGIATLVAGSNGGTSLGGGAGCGGGNPGGNGVVGIVGGTGSAGGNGGGNGGDAGLSISGADGGRGAGGGGGQDGAAGLGGLGGILIEWM